MLPDHLTRHFRLAGVVCPTSRGRENSVLEATEHVQRRDVVGEVAELSTRIG
jgi:hypothetical protein